MEFRFCVFTPRAPLFDVKDGGHEELGWNRFGGRLLLGECGFDEILAEVPEGAREFAEIAENVVECGDKAVDLLLADDKGRQDLHDVGVVGGNLSENPMFLKKRSDNHLGKEAFVHGVDGFPGEFEFERAGFLELDGNHQAFAADF